MNVSEQDVIRELIEKWAAAVRKKDIPAILSGHSPDIVMFDVPPPLQSKGIDAYKATWKLFFSASADPVVFDIIEMNVTAGSDVAFATSIMRCIDKSGGEAEELTFRLTTGLRKISGQWVITHEHHSLPAT